MSIKNWAPEERPREKLISKGAGALSDAELMAILLRTGVQGISAVELARQLLQRFGSLRGIFTASARDLQTQKGIGSASYTQFAVVREIGKRLLAEEMAELPCLNNPASVREYLRLTIGLERVEVVVGLFLNQQNQVIKSEELARGTVAENTVYIREVAKKALDLHAVGLIIAHNHPGGSLHASAADRQFTRRLKEALALLDLQLWDHFIVTAKDTVSFAEQGWL